MSYSSITICKVKIPRRDTQISQACMMGKATWDQHTCLTNPSRHSQMGVAWFPEEVGMLLVKERTWTLGRRSTDVHCRQSPMQCSRKPCHTWVPTCLLTSVFPQVAPTEELEWLMVADTVTSLPEGPYSTFFIVDRSLQVQEFNPMLQGGCCFFSFDCGNFTTLAYKQGHVALIAGRCSVGCQLGGSWRDHFPE